MNEKNTQSLLDLINKLITLVGKNVDNISAQINKSTTFTNNVAGQLKILKEMYDAGDLTQEEYTKAKKKILE